MALFKLTVTKAFAYRGVDEEFSNSYVFSGPNPADQTAWQAWADKVKDLEKPLFANTVRFVDWYGYDEGSWEAKPTRIDATGSWLASVIGTMPTSSSVPAPGDAAFWVRWDTGQFNSQGKKVYLRKYFHGCYLGAAGGDGILGAQRTAALAYGAKMYDGASLIGTARIARENGALPIAHDASTYATTRTLRRRGKRPPITP